MPDIWMDVDAALSEVPVNKVALVDDTDFKTREESVTYDQAGMDLVWNFITTAGAYTQTAVTPTTGGVHDWVNQGNGMYSIEIPASAGTISNDTEGFGWFTGFATGVLPWSGPVIGFRNAELNDIMVDATDGSQMPATQSQVSQIGSGGGSANNEFPILSPNGFVITTGLSEVNNEDATRAVGGDVHQISDNGGTLDVYYICETGGAFSPNTIVHIGRMNGNSDDVGVYVNTNTQASPTWVLRATLEGSNSSINQERSWKLENSDQMVGADAGKVAVRFFATGLSSATLTTDHLVVEKTTIASVTGYQDGRIWVNTVSGTAGTVVNVNGVADKAVDLWASALTISSSGGFANDFHIINGSTIALTGVSNNFSLFGDNWTLQLAGKSVAEAYFQGAHVSGVGISTSEVHYEGCDIATMSVQIGHFDFCSFSGTVTHTLAGDYNYHNCYSKVPGPLGPTFAKTAGQAITAQWRNWAGSINLTGLEVGDTLTIGGEEIGTIDLGSPAGAVVVEIRGIYKDLVNVGSASVNLDGAINAADVAQLLANLGTPIGLDGAAATVAAMLTKMADDNGGADFNATSDSQQALRDRGDAAWITATGFNTVVPDVAGTASTLHTTTDALITGISNVTRLSVAIPTYLERPPSGDKAIKVSVALKDTDGNMEDPDGNQLALLLANSGGTSRNSLLFKDFALTTALDAGTGTFSTFKALERTSTGLYFCYFKVAFDATEEEWLAQFGWEEGAVALYEFRATQVTDAANDLGVLLTRCSEVRMAELGSANLPADIDLILEDTGTTLPAQITALENLSSAGAQAAADAALVANHLDHLLKTDYDPASKPGTATALLNELIESNAGVSRYTAAALAQGPGGDANAANQTTIITHLTDVKGTAFVKDTDSMVDLAHTGADSDTLETLSDQIDGIVGGTGSGARSVTVTVNDGATVLENAIVRFTEGANTYAGPTNVSGVLAFSLDDATYAVTISKAGYTFTPTTLLVDGTKTPTYSMTAVSISAPPNASTTTGVAKTYDEEQVLEAGVSVNVQILDGPATAGIAYDSAVWTELSSALGVVQFAGIVHGAQYKIWRGDSKANAVTFTAPTTGDSFDLPEVIGRG